MMRLILASILILGVNAGARAAEAPNLLKDPGFEAAGEGGFATWSTPGYWQGALAAAAEPMKPHGGRRCAQLTATEKGGKWWGRVLNTAHPEILQGARYRLSFWAKGKGQLVLGAIEYAQQEGKTTYHYAPAETPADLSDDWREVTFAYTPREPAANSVALYAEVRGENASAFLDDALFAVDPLPGYALSVRASQSMVAQGGRVTLGLQAAAPAGAGPAAVAVSYTLANTPTPVRAEVKLNAAGKGEYAFTADEKSGAGVVAFTLVLKDAGVAETAYVDVVSPEEYQRFAAAAESARVEGPAHLVFVGDSLTAFYKGYNYVDKVRGWLQQKHGDAVAVTNAGVGGDYTTRVLARLEKDVLGTKPTHVFVFLGHNDSKLKSTTEYREPVVPADVFEKEYREIVQRIREKTGARVTIISATSSVYEITLETAQKAAKAGRAHSLFGKPEALEQFNAIARKVAAEQGCGYLDVYEPTRAHPNKPALFTADGVHISNEGNRLVALEILKYLGRK